MSCEQLDIEKGSQHTVKVERLQNESITSLLKRFNTECGRVGIVDSAIANSRFVSKSQKNRDARRKKTHRIWQQQGIFDIMKMATKIRTKQRNRGHNTKPLPQEVSK